MRNVTGGVAEGQDFFDRAKEVESFWADLETDSLLLLASRRVGKTSLMKKMAEQASGRGYTAILVDVSDCPDELCFVQRLYRAILETDAGDRLWMRMKDSWLGRTIQRVQKVGGYGFSVEFGANESSWARQGEEFVDALSRLEGRWLVQVDELPVFLLKRLMPEDSGRGRVREFLYWLRRVRQQFSGIRWFFAGSIGLDTVTARLNMADTINDLRIVTLGAFDADTADAMLARLANAYSIELSEDVRRHIVRRAGWPAPYYLQLIFHGIRRKRAAIVADVDAAIDDLLGPQHRSYFDYWRQRLFEELGSPDAQYAIALLNAGCRLPGGVSRTVLSQTLAASLAGPHAREEKLRYVLDVLRNDGYLVEAGSSWSFLFPLLREYWLRRVAPVENSHE
jgi:uncharacterized protein